MNIDINSIEYKFLCDYYNLLNLPETTNKNIKRCYNLLQKCIKYNLFNKKPELNISLLLYNYYILNQTDNKDTIKYLIRSVAGIIGSTKIISEGRCKLVGHTGAWNKGMKGMYHTSMYGQTKETSEHFKHLSELRSGQNNPMSKTNCPNRNPESAKKQSETLKQKILHGDFTPNTQNRLCHNKLIYDNIKFRSSWEAVFYYLNKDKNYVYESVRIPYISSIDNKNHVYITDFVDISNKIIYEIKPDHIMNTIQKDKYTDIIKACNLLGYTFIHLGDDWKNSIYDKDIMELKNTDIYNLFKPKVYNEN